MTLSAYNGGLGWVQRDQTLAAQRGLDRQRWFGHVATVNAGRAATNWRENRHYPQRILYELAPRYLTWGGRSLTLFKTYWPHLMILAAVAAFGYKFGHSAGEHAKQTDLRATIKTLRDSSDKKTAQILDYERDKRLAAEQYAAALQKALADTAAQRARADKLAAELLQTQTELSQANEERKKDIPHAIKNDGHAFTGIGPDSLRL